MAFANRLAASPAAAPSRSKYSGISCADTRDPMLGLGEYRVRVTACAEGYNPGKRRDSYKTSLHVVSAEDGSETRAGSSCTVVSFLTPAGLSELKRFAMHAAGFGPTLAQRASGDNVRARLIAGEEQYDALDESCGHQGAILEASTGVANGAPSLVGRLVDVVVARGKPVVNPQTGAETGDYYRVYTWGVVPEDVQP